MSRASTRSGSLPTAAARHAVGARDPQTAGNGIEPGGRVRDDREVGAPDAREGDGPASGAAKSGGAGVLREFAPKLAPRDRTLVPQ